MPTYPTSPAWDTPMVRALDFKTNIWTGYDGTEQRAMTHAGRESWTLSYFRRTVTERDSLITFFETAKGSAAQNISFTDTDSVTYSNLYFESDIFSATEQLQTRTFFDWTVKLCQVVRAPDTGSLPSDFPALTTTAKMQLPYTHSRTFDTVAVQTEGGRSAYSRRATSLRVWTVGGNSLKDSEAQAIWDIFRLARGMWASFGMTDPDSGTRYANCRFGTDKLEWRVLGAGQNAITATVRQFN